LKWLCLGEGKKQVVNMSQWVKLQLYDSSGGWKSKTIWAIVAPSFCSPIILGLLFLLRNKIIVDHEAHTTIPKDSGFNLLHPKIYDPKPACNRELKEFFHDLQNNRKLMLAELKNGLHRAQVAIQISSKTCEAFQQGDSNPEPYINAGFSGPTVSPMYEVSLDLCDMCLYSCLNLLIIHVSYHH
jgi:hypothetical protein